MIRLGAIGAGMVFGRYYAAARQFSDLQVIAIADPDPIRRAYWEAVGCQVVETAQELVHKQLDAVLVLTPNHMHCSAIMACLDAGKDVLCEKPLAVTVNEARTLIATASNCGVILFPAMHVRHRPEVRYFLRSCRARVAEFDQVWLEDWTRAPAWYREPRFAGGGVLLDVGINQIDWVRSVAGDLIPEKATVTLGDKGVEELCTVLWRFAGGTGRTELSWSGLPERRETYVCTHRGTTFKLNHSAGTVEHNGRTHGPWKGDEYAGVLREFIAVHNRTAEIDHEKTLQLFELIKDTYRLSGLPYLNG